LRSPGKVLPVATDLERFCREEVSVQPLRRIRLPIVLCDLRGRGGAPTACLFVLSLIWPIFSSGLSVAAPPPADLEFVAPAEQTAIDDLDQRLADDEVEAAVDRCIRLIDEGGDRLVALRVPFEQPLERYLPMRLVVQDRLLRWGQIRPELLDAYRKRTDAVARQQFVDAQQLFDSSGLQSVVRGHWASSVADDALLALADRELSAGHATNARRWLERIDARWQAVAQAVDPSTAPRGPWPALPLDLMLSHAALAGPVSADGVSTPPGPTAGAEQGGLSRAPIGTYIGSDVPPASIAIRWILCACLDGQIGRATRAADWIAASGIEGAVDFAGRRQDLAAASAELLADAANWPLPRRREAWSTFGGDWQRGAIAKPLGELPPQPRWLHFLGGEGAKALAAQRAEALEIRRAVPSGEPIGGLPMHPIAVDGRVWVQRGPEIFAFDLMTGVAGPGRSGEHSGTTGNTSTANVANLRTGASSLGPIAAGEIAVRPTSGDEGLVFRAQGRWRDLGLQGDEPIVGSPRYTLSADGTSIWARVGPAITGWYRVDQQTPGSRAQLVGLDALAEGRLLDGWPKQLVGARWEGYEFDGTPLVIDGVVYAPLLRRDRARIDVHVAAFEQSTAEMLWVTPLLFGSRSLEGTQAQRISHNLISASGDLLFLHAHLGACVAIDRHTGRTRWAVRYPRTAPGESRFVRPDRQRFRELTPPLVVDELVVLAAADSERLWAFRATDGQLAWSSAAEQGADVTHLLGAIDGRLIASGDHLYWIDLLTGRFLASFPGGGGEGPQLALPSPRGIGRGLIAGASIYWPTAESVFVFQGSLEAAAEPRIQQILDLRPSGLTGGVNLLASEGVLVAAGQDRVAGWVTTAPPVTRSDRAPHSDSRDW
jgi:outer membrane protein assembly factor BamB